MSVTFVLTDEQSDVLGYKRARFAASGSPPQRSDTPSLVQAVTTTTNGGTSIQCTRLAAAATPVYGDATLAWITDPFDGNVNVTARAWTVVQWALEATAADHVGVNVQVLKFSNGAEGATVLTGTSSELGTTTKAQVMTPTASATTLAAGDRLVVKVFAVNVGGTMKADTMTISYNGQYPAGDGDTYLVCLDDLVLQATVPSSTSTAVLQLLHDEGNVLISAPELTKVVGDALRQFSTDRQRLVADYYNGDAVNWAYPLPRNWVWGFSDLIEIEYPATYPPGTVGGIGAQTRMIMGKAEDWEIVESSVNNQPQRQIWFRTFIPDAGSNNLCLRYTTRHRHDSLIDTIPAEDYMAFCWLAAAYAANVVASKFAAVSDSSITADATDYKSRHQYWSEQAAEFMALYDDHIRGEEPPVMAVSRNTNWDTNLSFYDLDRITHPRRWR